MMAEDGLFSCATSLAQLRQQIIVSRNRPYNYIAASDPTVNDIAGAPMGTSGRVSCAGEGRRSRFVYKNSTNISAAHTDLASQVFFP
jgi:hypothetical protein